jgi:hypothetical protein
MDKKVLSIKLVGHDFVKAFKNENKTDSPADTKLPDYKGDGVAVWIHTYKEKKPLEQAENEPEVKEEKVL